MLTCPGPVHQMSGIHVHYHYHVLSQCTAFCSVDLKSRKKKKKKRIRVTKYCYKCWAACVEVFSQKLQAVLCLFYTKRCMLRPRSERRHWWQERGKGEERLCSSTRLQHASEPSQITSSNRFYIMIITHRSVVPICLWSGAFCQRSSKNLASGKIRAKIL